MRIIAQGHYNGEEVKVSWSEEDWLDGPGPVLRALIDKSADITGTPVGMPPDEVIYYGYLQHRFGFVFVAKMVLQNVHFEYPDGAPKPLLPSTPDAYQ